MCLGSHYDRSVDFEIVEPGMVVCLYKIYLLFTKGKGNEDLPEIIEIDIFQI